MRGTGVTGGVSRRYSRHLAGFCRQSLDSLRATLKFRELGWARAL